MPDFREILDNLPEKPPRSRLEPYRELILEMRRRGRPFREIAQVLGEKCGVPVVPSTIHDFLNAAASQERKSEPKALRRARAPKLIHPGRNPGRDASPDEVERRIAALKAKEPHPQTVPERFRFVPGEPLRLPKPPRTRTEPD
jgi:hypothetical protein